MCSLDDIPHHQSHVIPNPIIRFDELNRRERDDLCARMNELTEKIIREFLSFQSQTLDAIRGNVCCNNLMATLHRVVKFSGKEVTEVDVFMKVLPYCSYFNYGILETIVEVHNLDKDPLEKYLVAFRQYCQAMPCIETVCGDTTPTPGRYSVEFKLTGKRNEIKVDTVQSIRRNIAGHLGINYSALYLLFVKNGCVLFGFLVPDFIVESSFSFFEDRQIIALCMEIGVISITIHYPHGVQVNDALAVLIVYDICLYIFRLWR